MLKSIVLSLSVAGAVNAYTVVNHDLIMYKNIDPIVKPGAYNSHMHSFFGSDAVTKDLPTSAELQAGCATGDNPNDLSVYWIPTLYHVNGNSYTPISPMRFSTYYEGIAEAEIPIPQDYHVVLGNAGGTSQADVVSGTGVTWFCEGDPGEDKDDAAFPSKTCSTHLQTLLFFHDCVDPVSLNSTYNNVGYGTQNRCPQGWKRMPRLRFSIRYDLRKILPNGWSGAPPLALACGTSYCSHGDFINGWFEDAAENMLLATNKREYMRIDGEHGNGNTESTCTAQDADPDNGTSDYQTSVTMMSTKRRRGFLGHGHRRQRLE